jgi:hypothetical protein
LRKKAGILAVSCRNSKVSAEDGDRAASNIW